MKCIYAMTKYFVMSISRKMSKKDVNKNKNKYQFNFGFQILMFQMYSNNLRQRSENHFFLIVQNSHDLTLSI